MLKVTQEMYDFNELYAMSWGNASEVLEEAENQGREEEAFSIVEETFPNGASDTEINDFISYSLADIMSLYE